MTHIRFHHGSTARSLGACFSSRREKHVDVLLEPLKLDLLAILRRRNTVDSSRKIVNSFGQNHINIGTYISDASAFWSHTLI